MPFYDREWTWLTKKEFLPLKEKFIVKNLKKLQAKNMKMWNWMKMPSHIKHFKLDESKNMIKIPNWLRSFFNFENRYWKIKKVNHPDLFNKYKWNELDIKQDKAVSELLERNVWFLHASTSIWKTICLAKIIDKLKVRTLIVVQWITLMTQMRDDLEEIFSVKCKTLSGTKTKQKGAYEWIIIWNIDTIVKQSKDWLQEFDLVVIDEVDSCGLTAERRLEFTWNITANFLYWMTWTIKLNHVDNKIFPIYLWKKTELLEKNFIPTINKVFTGFEYHLDDMKKFYELKEALYTWEDRNKLIVKTVVDNLWKRKWIVFCEHIAHAELLTETFKNYWIKTFLLIWKIKKADREQVKKELIEYKWPCILVGSVKIIGRWFNVPELSIGFITTAEKFLSNIEQYVWRIIRKFPWKTNCIWYDFVDDWCSILLNQSKSRNSTYRREYPNCKINLI